MSQDILFYYFSGQARLFFFTLFRDRLFFFTLFRARLFFSCKTRDRKFFWKITQAPPRISNGRPLTNPKLNLSMIMYIQNLVKFCPFVLKILSKNQILTSIKGRNSDASFGKMMLYNPNVDLVTDNVCIKFG